MSESNQGSLLELNEIDEETKEEIEDLIIDKIEPEENKKILVYKTKSVSICKLICHLSGKLEIFLMIIAVIATVFSGCTDPFWNLLMGSTINELAFLSDLTREDPLYKAKVEKAEPPVNRLILQFVILGEATFISNFLMLFLWGLSALRQMHFLKKNYFELIMSQEQEWFDENNEFQFSTKIQTQLEQIEYGLGDKFGQIILMIAEISSGLIVGFLTAWDLALIICASFPIIVISVIITDNCAEKLMLKSKDANEKAGGIAEELLYNIKTITCFCNFDFEIKRYNELIDEIDQYDQKKVLIESVAYGLLYLASFGSVAFVLVHARNLKLSSNTEEEYRSGDFVVVVSCVLDVIYSVSGLGPSFQVVQKACVASSDYFVLLSKKKKDKKKKGGYIPSREDFQGKIEFKNVCFSYPKDRTRKMVLDDLNLIVEPGQKVALVGESGCGKSTTISLIEKFYEVNSGQILIDDIDINEYDKESLRDLIGYVQQEPVLFNTSIKDNIVFGREAKLEKMGFIDQMVRDSCDEAYISKFILKNEEKYDYVVGVKGSKLSGGQRQRIAIARAILMKPKILILDEATSSLDNKAEKKVQKALDNICQKEITSFVISHRLSTIKNSDMIYAMRDGKIVEYGTHQELIEKNGYYFSLIREQLTEEEVRLIKERNEMNSININMSTNMSIYFDKFNESINLSDSDLVIDKKKDKDKQKNKKEEKINIDKKKIWELVSGHKCSLAIGVIAGLIYGAISPVIGLGLGWAISSLSSNDKKEFDDHTKRYIIFFAGIAVLGGLSIFLKIWKLQSLGLIISKNIKKKMIKKYLELNMTFFDEDKHSPGTLSTKLAIDSGQLDSLILNFVGGILTCLSTFVIACILGIIHSYKITLILIGFAPLMIIGSIKKDDYKENGNEASKGSKVEAGSFLSECVINMKTIFSFNFQNRANIIYRQFLDGEKKNFIRNSFMQGFWLGLSLSAINFAFAVVYKVGFILLKDTDENGLDFEDLMCTMYIIFNSCDGLSDILRNMGEYSKAKLAYKSIFDVLDTRIDYSPFPENNKLKLIPNDLQGRIEFKNVYFSYPTKPNQLILNNLSFVIEPGQKVGLVGLSGSGKSTIIKLIDRFYDVTSGEILIDGENIKNYNLYELRKKIGFIEQEPTLFKRNIYENILYGKLDAQKDEVIDMAKKSKISNLLYEDFAKKENPLSGGQKQRVSIARAFLKDPAIILLDEATSAMDVETELEIQKNIYELAKDKTSVTVAHRLNTIENSDAIFVLDHGQLSEKGTHEELIKLKGKYYTLYKYSKK